MATHPCGWLLLRGAESSIMDALDAGKSNQQQPSAPTSHRQDSDPAPLSTQARGSTPPATGLNHRLPPSTPHTPAGGAHGADDEQRCVRGISEWLECANSGDIPPSASAIVARLRQQWTAIDTDAGGGSGGKMHRRIQLLRAMSHEAGRYACLAHVIDLATQLDPMLPWVNTFGEMPAIASRTLSGGASSGGSWWGRWSGTSSPTDNANVQTRTSSSPCAVDGACPECRAAMLRHTYLCGRYLVLPPDQQQHAPPSLCGGSACAATLWARDTMAHRVPGGAAPEHVLVVFLRDRQAWIMERTVRVALAKAVGSSGVNTLVTRLVRAHDASPGALANGASIDDGCLESCSDTIGEELDARCLALAPFLLVFERTGQSLDAALAAQRTRLHGSGHDALLGGLPPPWTVTSPTVFRAVVVRTHWPAVRSMAYHTAVGLAAFHQAGLLHGSLCPAHVVASWDCARWCLTCMNAAVALANGGQLMCAPSGWAASRGYVPPEGVMRCEDGTPALRLVERGTTAAWTPGTLAAAVSWDMWSFGALLFEASAGVTVLQALAAASGEPASATSEPSDVRSALDALAAWDMHALEASMAVWQQLVGEDAEICRSAAALLRRCLSPEPCERPVDARELLMSRFLNPGGSRVPVRAVDIISQGGPVSAAASPESATHSAVLIGVARSESPGSALNGWEGAERSSSWPGNHE